MSLVSIIIPQKNILMLRIVLMLFCLCDKVELVQHRSKEEFTGWYFMDSSDVN